MNSPGTTNIYDRRTVSVVIPHYTTPVLRQCSIATCGDIFIAMNSIFNRLAVVAPTIEADLSIFNKNLRRLECQLKSANIDFLFVVIFQSKNTGMRAHVNDIYGSFCKVLHSDVLNVSHARNLGIEYIEELDFQGRVLFFDSTISFDKSVWEVFKSPQTTFLPLWFTHVNWTSIKTTSRIKCSQEASVKMTIADVFYRAYVWSAFFSVNLLKGLRFDERFGVGPDAIYQGGEDVLFIVNAFLKNGSEACSFPCCDVYHPPRPLNFSKHLKYARGTGAMFGCLIRSCESSRYRVLFIVFLMLSVCNALLRCLLLRKYSFLILKLRIFGFLDSINGSQVRL